MRIRYSPIQRLRNLLLVMHGPHLKPCMDACNNIKKCAQWRHELPIGKMHSHNLIVQRCRIVGTIRERGAFHETVNTALVCRAP